jgi:hypothetical protein
MKGSIKPFGVAILGGLHNMFLVNQKRESIQYRSKRGKNNCNK